MEEILDDVLPKKVTEAYDKFAEVKTFAQGEKVAFRRKLNNRARAKMQEQVDKYKERYEKKSRKE